MNHGTPWPPPTADMYHNRQGKWENWICGARNLFMLRIFIHGEYFTNYGVGT